MFYFLYEKVKKNEEINKIFWENINKNETVESKMKGEWEI
jgi:hypothetical protein